MKPNVRKIKKSWILFLSFLFMASLIQHLTPANRTYAATKTAYSTTNDLNLRKKASSSSSSKILKKFNKGDSFLVTGSTGKWYKVTSGDIKGYVYKSYVTFTKPSKNTTSSKSGAAVVSYAKKFLGNPYVYGGTSLTKGTDCSGFTQSVYKKFGIHLPRTSSQQRKVGKKVSSLSKAKSGDLICYYGHVAIYMGNNKIIHASSAKTGIKISNNASYRTIASIRRVL